METVFQRFEKKFVVTHEQRDEIIRTFLSHQFKYDMYSPDGKTYSIYTIYYDTKDFHVVRQSLTGKTYREKFRVRFYEYPLKEDSLVFLEIKKKLAGKGNKRRLGLTYRDATNYISHRVQPTVSTPIDKQILNELNYYLSNYDVVPFTFIRYNRVAMFSPNDDIRVTFDEDIEYSVIASLSNANTLEALPQSKNLILMEIKSLSNYPLWLSNLLTAQKVYSKSFSKYKNTYQTLHEGGIIHAIRT